MVADAGVVHRLLLHSGAAVEATELGAQPLHVDVRRGEDGVDAGGVQGHAALEDVVLHDCQGKQRQRGNSGVLHNTACMCG